MNDESPIVVTLSGDISPLRAQMVEAVAVVKTAINSLKAEFVSANQQLKLTPKTDAGAREELLQYGNTIAAQVRNAENNLARLTNEYESAARRIADANKIINAPLERETEGPNRGRFIA